MAELEPLVGKPGPYRVQARLQTLWVIKKKRPSARQQTKAIGKQLRYLGRNLPTVDLLLQQPEASLSLLQHSKRRRLWVINELLSSTTLDVPEQDPTHP